MYGGSSYRDLPLLNRIGGVAANIARSSTHRKSANCTEFLTLSPFSSFGPDLKQRIRPSGLSQLPHQCGRHMWMPPHLFLSLSDSNVKEGKPVSIREGEQLSGLLRKNHCLCLGHAQSAGIYPWKYHVSFNLTHILPSSVTQDQERGYNI